MTIKEFGKVDDSLIVVSAVVPCYNVETKIINLLESLLIQTYRNLQLILVNDGSTDHTEEVILRYVPQFVDLGMQVIYILQENQGPGGAVNTGIKQVTGQYLIWPDADDWLSSNSIQRKMEVLESNPGCGVVTTNAYTYQHTDLSHPSGKMIPRVDETILNPNQFDALIHYKSTFCPGCHMIRMSMMRDVNPDMDIFPSRGGQNFQMLMPIYYKYPRIFVDECLFHYVVYADSHSRSNDTLEKSILKADGLLEIICQTLDRMQMPDDEREKYKAAAQIDDLCRRYPLGMRFCDRAYSLQIDAKLEACGHISDIPMWQRRIVRNNVLFGLYTALDKAKKCVKRMLKRMVKV